MKRLAFALLLLATPANAQSDYPRAITEHEKATIREAVKRHLKDPDSARFRWNPELMDSAAYCGFVNAKNAMGGYGGFAPFLVVLGLDNTVLQVELSGQADKTATIIVSEICGTRDYNLNAANPLAKDD